MLTKRPRAARGFADHGWLQTRHSFSFANYVDPAHMQFRALRVINEDTIAGGRGFGRHPHRDMEILTCVISGALAHDDSMGTGSRIVPGEMQRMYAGTGVVHSEFNASETQPVHLLQIWLLPMVQGLAPAYTQRAFDKAAQHGRLVCLASPDGRDDSITILADCRLYRGSALPGADINIPIAPGRALWIQIVSGVVSVDGERLEAGDGAAIEAQPYAILSASGASDVLVFDLG